MAAESAPSHIRVNRHLDGLQYHVADSPGDAEALRHQSHGYDSTRLLSTYGVVKNTLSYFVKFMPTIRNGGHSSRLNTARSLNEVESIRAGVFKVAPLRVEADFNITSQFAALKYSPTALPIDVQEVRIQWEDFVKKTGRWSSISDILQSPQDDLRVCPDYRIGPHNLYSNDPAIIEGYEKLIPQKITIF